MWQHLECWLFRLCNANAHSNVALLYSSNFEPNQVTCWSWIPYEVISNGELELLCVHFPIFFTLYVEQFYSFMLHGTIVAQVCCYFSMKKDILLIEFQSENKRTGTVHGPRLCISEGLVPLMDQLGHWKLQHWGSHHLECWSMPHTYRRVQRGR